MNETEYEDIKFEEIQLPEVPITEMWRAMIQCNRSGKPRPTETNAMIFIDHLPALQGVFAFDTLKEAPITLKDLPFKVDDPAVLAARLAGYLAQETGASFSIKTIEIALEVSSRRHQIVNPVTGYLDNLKWDRYRRLECAARTYLGTPVDQTSDTFFHKWIIAAVARAYDPGCQVDTMLVLEGPQGLGKTTALQALLPNKAWYRETAIDAQSKDGAMLNLGCWIREIGELTGMKQQDLSALKMYISQREDSYRPPYERWVRGFKRRIVFAGTTNKERYLNDPTGGRRFWPIHCGVTHRIEIARIENDRDQLWAEAKEWFYSKEKWYLDSDFEREYAMPEQRKRLTPYALKELEESEKKS